MARQTAKGRFTPKNPEKLMKRGAITYRSGWELQLMNYLDSHPSVVAWASEPVSIPYRNPLTNKSTFYWPDFIVTFIDKQGTRRTEMIEVKPLKEDFRYTGRVDQQTKLKQAINAAKWKAASEFCARAGIFFRVMTEADMFGAKR